MVEGSSESLDKIRASPPMTYWLDLQEEPAAVITSFILGWEAWVRGGNKWKLLEWGKHINITQQSLAHPTHNFDLWWTSKQKLKNNLKS